VAEAKPTPATRDLAQAGTVAGAIFGALVGADPFDIRHRTSWVKTVDYVAIALWVAAVLLFLLTAAPRASAGPPRLSERLRLRLALLTAGAAGLLTIVALIAVPMPFSADYDNVALSLAPQEQRAISELCHVTTTPLQGRVQTQTFGDAFVVVEGIPTQAGARCDAVRIPATGILAVEEHPRGASG
jgi:hypothetical protein